jgi:biopolymer transport protein ExbD
MPRSHKMGTEEVQADLPITPMLDMSFQLLAFFIMTFHPAPTETQIALALPQVDGGGSSIPDPTSDKPTKYIVHVHALENGQIKSLSVKEEGAATDAKDIGADAEKGLLPELKRLLASLNGKPAKLTVEIEENLLEAYVIQVIDASIQAGFTDISPVPADPKKR